RLPYCNHLGADPARHRSHLGSRYGNRRGNARGGPSSGSRRLMESAEALIAQLSRSLELVDEYQGGQGRTFRARTTSGTHLSIKVLPLGEQPSEAAIAASMLHPSIPQVHEAGHLADGRAFVVRDHVEGQVLTSLPRSPQALRPV